MMCKVRNPSRRGGWRSRGRGAVGRRAAVRGFHDALDQVVSQDSKWLLRCYGLAAWWTLTLLSLFLCRFAYAAPSIEINGNYAATSGGVDYKGYMVVDCPNEYIASLTLIGEYSSLVQIDSDMYAKLSNESSGGRFYELVQEWQKVGTSDGVNEYWPSWAGSLLYQEGVVTVYGYGRVWGCAITDALKAGAKQDFLTILDGGSIGGGGGGSIPDTGTVWLTPLQGSVPSSATLVYSGHGNKVDDEFTISLDSTTLSNANDTNWLSQYPYYVIVGKQPQDYSTDTNFVYRVPEGVKIKYVNGVYKGCFKEDGSRFNYAFVRFYINARSYTTSFDRRNTQTSTYISPDPYISLTGIDDGNDEPGDNNWPDDDTPQPPSPNPPTPTIPDPDPGPTLPPIDPHDPVIPSPPTNEPAPTGTTPTDYTPWLRAILQQLVNLTSYLETCFTWLGTALDDHCQHIRDHMTTCFNWLGEYEITGMSNLLGEHHTFLNGLAQWIVDNIKWENSVGEFDDSNMIYWLRRIYARQGAGDVNSRPVDPATDYSGFAGWLGVLYDAVALDVSDTSLTALTGSLSGLQHTFPFSLPWDVKQVLQALDVSPVTPSASIPSGTSGVSYNVDLHWMDSAMVSVRAFELLVFIVYVMVHTKDLFGYLMGE